MNIKLQYFIYGVLFGACFPVFAIILQLKVQEQPLSMENILFAHKQNVLLYMIDTAPLFLGLFAFLGGISKHKVNQILSEFKVKAEELNKSNDYIEAHSAEFFEELTRSTHRVEGIASTILKSNTSLYNNNETNRKFAEKIYKETTELLLFAENMAKLNGEFDHLIGRLNLSVEGFKELMGKLSGNLRQVGAVGKEINMISINSSIEAHKAQEAGSGFKVISQEVKTLSEQIEKTITNTQTISASLQSQVVKIEGFIQGQNKNLESIIQLLSGIEGKTVKNKDGLSELSLLLKDTYEIQEKQKHSFDQMLIQIEGVKSKRTQIINQLKQELSNNSKLIVKLGRL